LFEEADRLGGHAYTVEVEDGGRTLGLDTAFIVYNEPHYPMLCKFFAELGVAGKDHPGRFSFFDLDAETCYVSEDFDLTEEQVRAKYPEKFVRLWREAQRFYTESPRDFIRKRAEIPLGEYLDRNGYSAEFRYGFVVLIATAAWSVPADKIWEMPASTIIAFFFAHGGEGLGGRTVPWRTVAGGSISYVRRVHEELLRAGSRVVSGTRVTGVRETSDEDGPGVVLTHAAGVQRFDQVVMATHADDSLALLEKPSQRQRMLEAVRYSPTRATLHTDAGCMGADRSLWRSWNYGRIGDGDAMRTWVVYYLNELQDFTAERDYFLTLDCGVDIPEDSIIEDIAFRHPVLTNEVRQMQRDLRTLNSPESPVKFAGSYIHSRKLGPDIIGNHESAFDSGMAAADAVLAEVQQMRRSA
jgi:predicted NAD/FAD-binding protein